MKIKSTLLACALLSLAGCATDTGTMGNGGAGATSGSSMGSSGSSSTGSTGSGSSGTGSSTGSTSSSLGSSSQAPSTAGTQDSRSTTGTTSSAQAGTTGSGVVQAIDQITRQDATSMGLSTGAAAAGGSLGSPSDKVYRVTVRLDDGTTQTVLAESMPSYKSGDRVRYANGIVTRESQ